MLAYKQAVIHDPDDTYRLILAESPRAKKDEWLSPDVRLTREQGIALATWHKDDCMDLVIEDGALVSWKLAGPTVCEPEPEQRVFDYADRSRREFEASHGCSRSTWGAMQDSEYKRGIY